MDLYESKRMYRELFRKYDEPVWIFQPERRKTLLPQQSGSDVSKF